ncbi:hypothetical protein C8D92_102214 [Tamilnaduibacter salinus]|uniref:Uncharacterized protein n=1 Tax=Tamilnaduibacter salinus TaxID=1484056 RepID=A0A2U1CZH1_9GAMM|nr:hypothetical protein [Tamilnaduibacter salinus]PVY78177.1 hypothetical protein C8D92_102214 [Tamilnaduibacter salinus]
MLVGLVIVLLVLIAVQAWLLYAARRQRQNLEKALETVESLSDGSVSDAEPEMVLTLRVIDPIGVAKRESRSARVVADYLPVLVRKQVYQQVIREVGAELSERGIDADLNIEYR